MGITYNEAKKLLDSLKGVTFAAMDTVTVPTLKGGKGNPMQGKVEKRCKGHRVMLFSNAKSNGYLNKVRRELEREGKNPDSFQLGKLPWGQRIEDSPFIEHKGKYYLQCVFLESGAVEYQLDGQPIAKEQVQGLNERTGSEHQGLSDERQVIVRTFALDSIVALRAFHEELA